MKKTCFLLLVMHLSFSYYGYGQKVSISLNNAPLEKAFSEIKKQTGYTFIYTRAQLAKTLPVTLKLYNTPLKSVLDECFINQPLNYSIDGNYIVVKNRQVEVQSEKKITPPISGKVVDQSSNPLANVTITAKRSKAVGISNEKGLFTLQEVAADDILIITSIGYEQQEIPVNHQSYISITMKQLISELDETIVVAYGTTTKRYSTGSESKISADDINKQPVSNPLAAMQGRISGLNIVQTGGLPGSNFSVLIRGRNSIQNGTSPLFVIDGIPFFSDADRMTQFSQVNANSPFNTLNPSDIESITVLKDADATSIYGSRGANGVILITTKKGSSGKTTIDVNIYRGWGKTEHNVTFMNTQEYLDLRREAFKNDNAKMSKSNAPDLLVWDSTRYIDWKKELIGGTADISNIQFRLEGGSKNTLFSLSGNHYKETTVFPGDANLKRGAVGLTVNHKSNDNKFSFDFEGSYASNNSHLYQQDLTQFINTVPNAPEPFDSLGNLNWSDNGSAITTHPLANIFRHYNVITNRLTGNTILSYRIGKLLLKSSIGYNAVNTDENSTFPISSQNPSLNPKGASNFGDNNTHSWIIEPQIHYNLFIVPKVNIQLLAGSTFQESSTNSKLLRGSGYTNDLLLNSTSAAATLTGTAYNGLKYKYQAIYGRATANYNKKYLLNLSFRRDGSSRFGPGNQFADFTSVGAGWILSDEKWVQSAKDYLSFAKLRASYGVVGNDQIGDYQFMDTWSSTTYSYGGVSGLYPTRLTNPYFSWERKKNIELGVDLGFCQDNYLLTINFFRSRSDNQIIRYTLPEQTGSNNVLMNFPGVVENKGFEIESSGKIIKRADFSWILSFNLTIPRNKLVSFPGIESSSYANSYVVGEPLSVLRGYYFLGVDPASGVYTFRDINGDGLYNNSDYTTIGNTDPKFYGGINNNFQWKGFEVQCFLQFVKQLGRDFIYSNGSQKAGQRINQPKELLDRWREKGDVVAYQQSTQSSVNPAFSAASLTSLSSAILTDASFCRLKNISLSYTLNHQKNLLWKFRLMRLFIEGQNLLLLTSYRGGSPESQGRLALPPLKTFAIGFQFKL